MARLGVHATRGLPHQGTGPGAARVAARPFPLEKLDSRPLPTRQNKRGEPSNEIGDPELFGSVSDKIRTVLTCGVQPLFSVSATRIL